MHAIEKMLHGEIKIFVNIAEIDFAGLVKTIQISSEELFY